MITNKRAREIAAEWYGGQWTSLYKVSCNEDTRALSLADWTDAIGEATEEADDAWTMHRYREARALCALVDWMRNKRRISEHRIH